MVEYTASVPIGAPAPNSYCCHAPFTYIALFLLSLLIMHEGLQMNFEMNFENNLASKLPSHRGREMSTPRAGRLAGKVVLITGAAQGIGKASALVSSVFSFGGRQQLTIANLPLQRCKEEGAKVVATDINMDQLHRLQQEQEQELEQVHVARLDVSSRADVEAVLAQHSDINVLFNCAG